jgi:hypothetical protein
VSSGGIVPVENCVVNCFLCRNSSCAVCCVCGVVCCRVVLYCVCVDLCVPCVLHFITCGVVCEIAHHLDYIIQILYHLVLQQPVCVVVGMG